MDIQFGYTTVVRLLFSQWNLARSQFLARRGTIFDFERVEIGNLYTFLFFRSSRLLILKNLYSILIIHLFIIGMADSFEQSHEIITECNGSRILENYLESEINY